MAIVKILDNIVLTAKSICTFKEKRLLSSVLVIVSQLIFYFVVNQVINDSTILAIIIVSVSSGIGNYIAFLINDRVKKPSKWTIVITSSNVDDIQRLCGGLIKQNIKNIACKGLNRKNEDTLHLLVFCENKAESKILEELLTQMSSKYLRERI